MNTDTPEVQADKQRSILNILAIIGFIAAVLVVAWLSILFVRALPNIFTSLASLSDSLYKPGGHVTEIIINTNTEATRSGESVTISWSESTTPGTYTFAYDCVDGVAIEIITTESAQPVRCDTTYSIGTAHSVTLRITSEKADAIVIPYTISFLRTNDTEAHSQATSTLAVSGASTIEAPVIPTPEPVVEVTPTPAPVTVTVPTKPAVTRAPSYSYYPVSNPNGYTDLSVRFLELGEAIGDRLVTKATLSTADENFFRFEVKNIGTKTSNTWDYTVKLPDGTTYERTARTALLPSERATITIRFHLDSKIINERVVVTTTTKNDTAGYNNNLTWATNVR